MCYWCSLTQPQRNVILVSFTASPCQVHNVQERTNHAYKTEIAEYADVLNIVGSS